MTASKNEIIKALKKERHDLETFESTTASCYSEEKIESMSKREIYAHIRALYTQIGTLKNYCFKQINIAERIISDWDRLNQRLESDDELRNHWQSILISMKMMDE